MNRTRLSAIDHLRVRHRPGRVIGVLVAALALAVALWRPIEPRAGGTQNLVPIGNSFQVNTFTRGYQGGPRVGMDLPGKFTVVWNSTDYSFPQDGSKTGVFGMRFGSLGQPLGSEFRVNTYTTDEQAAQGAKQTRFGAQSTFAVTWSSNLQDGSERGTFLQIYHDGVPESGDDLQVNTATSGNQAPSDVFLTPKGVDLRGGVCFEGASLVGAQTEVYCRTGVYGDSDPYARSVDGGPQIPARQLQGSEFQVNSYTTGYQGRPSACGLDAGEFVVAWADFGRDQTISMLFGRRGDVDSGVVGSEFEITTNTSASHDRPHVCCGDGGFVVVWENGAYPTSIDGDGPSVSARRFDASAQPLGTEFVVTQITSGTQQRASLACDATGNFIVSWEASDVVNGGIFARAFAADGQPLTDDTFIANTNGYSAVGMSNHGTAVVAWSAATLTGNLTEVLARRFSVPGLGGSTTTTTVEGTTTTVGGTTTTTFGGGAVCGDPVDPGSLVTGSTPARVVTASDALHTLRTAVGSATCLLCVCDVNDSGGITASDALVVLRFAVGQPVVLDCPPCN